MCVYLYISNLFKLSSNCVTWPDIYIYISLSRYLIYIHRTPEMVRTSFKVAPSEVKLVWWMTWPRTSTWRFASSPWPRQDSPPHERCDTFQAHRFPWFKLVRS